MPGFDQKTREKVQLCMVLHLHEMAAAMRLVEGHTFGAVRRFTLIEPVSVTRLAERQVPSEAVRERLFEGLDGQPITAGDDTWHVHVYSVWEEAAGWWVQLLLDGRNQYTVTMRLPRFPAASDTLSRLARWLRSSQGDESLTVA